MEEIREIATSYYERATKQEKALVQDFFTRLDSDKDGQVTLLELRNAVGSWLSDEKLFKIFKQLDRNCDGTLDFYEALPVYYMVHKVKMVACSGCWDLLLGPYFSCLLCVAKQGLDTFDLCCACYRGGRVAHEHSYEYLLDHHTLIEVIRNRNAKQENSGIPRKSEMDELREIAKAHYQAASPKVQTLAYEFFRSMDTDGDGRVNLWDFMSFMRQEGYTQMHNTNFFKELDPNGYGTLGFYEVMTLYYILKSGRPFCTFCGNFIPGIYFSCVECHMHPYYQASFNLCRDCYCSRKCDHNHEGRPSQFLDNYTLLQIRRDSSSGFTQGNAGSSKWVMPSNAMVPAQQGPYPTQPYYNNYNGYNLAHSHSFNSSSALTESNNNNNSKDKWRMALKALDVAVTVGQIAAPAAACSIM